MIAIGWWRLYGFPLDLRLWVAFFVHDLGYFGKPNMDGPEGEIHPEFGAAIMRRLFGDEWGDFCLLHSRYYAKRVGRPVSALCTRQDGDYPRTLVALHPEVLALRGASGVH
ncbi:hypothetical protein [Verrucomicrobium sp. GAS474]|uniref:hypothetical protein n=1 Tax=Verrucomicrobium sp. GAS474 TaxID=1882831 RepID=UPI0012FFB65D|nr:hypothetical protein [Verrucomicrobium sp. GAS474]